MDEAEVEGGCAATLIGQDSVVRCQVEGEHTEHRAQFEAEYAGCPAEVTAAWTGPPTVLDLRDEQHRWKPWNGLQERQEPRQAPGGQATGQEPATPGHGEHSPSDGGGQGEEHQPKDGQQDHEKTTVHDGAS